MESDPVVLGRVIERILITCFAGASLFLGYRLFFVSLHTHGDLEASGGDKIYFRMRNVAPGVFFALFGAAILVISLIWQINIPRTETATDEPEVDHRSSSDMRFLTPALDSSNNSGKATISALSALIRSFEEEADFRSRYIDNEELLIAKEITSGLKRDLVDVVFREGSYAFYIETQALRVTNPEIFVRLTREEREEFREIERTLETQHFLKGDRE